MNFSSKGEKFVENEKVSQWLTPGSAQIAKISDVEYFETKSGSTGLKFHFEGRPMAELQNKGQKAEATMWLTEKALPYTKDNVRLIMEKMGTREEFDNESESVKSGKEYADLVMKFVRNKPMAYLFGGEVVILKDEEGKPVRWVKPTLYRYGFVAPVEELGNLEERASKLGSEKLIREPEMTTTDAVTTESTGTSDDLDW
jgi:hypothetical protein